jgi:hypothetical protein
MKTTDDNLRMLMYLVACVRNDIEKFLEEPQDFNAPEYFVDVLEAANDAQNLILEVRDQLKGESK